MFYRSALLFSKLCIKKTNVLPKQSYAFYKINVSNKKPNPSYNLLRSPFHTTFNRTFAFNASNETNACKSSQQKIGVPITHYSETLVCDVLYSLKINHLWTMLILNNLNSLELYLNLSKVRDQNTQSYYYDKFMNLQRYTYNLQCRYIPLGRKLEMSSKVHWDFEMTKRASITFAPCKRLVLPTPLQQDDCQEGHLSKKGLLRKEGLSKFNNDTKFNHDIDFPLAILSQMNIFKEHEYAGIVDYVESRKKRLISSPDRRESKP